MERTRNRVVNRKMVELRKEGEMRVTTSRFPYFHLKIGQNGDLNASMKGTVRCGY